MGGADCRQKPPELLVARWLRKVSSLLPAALLSCSVSSVSSQDHFGARPVNRAAFPLRALNWPVFFPRERHGLPSSVVAPNPNAVMPSCRLRLDGRNAQENACDILAMSAEGVTIVLNESRSARRGQLGHLLIGSAEGSHYTLPVAVRGVKPFPHAAIVELTFPPAERWRYTPPPPQVQPARN
jgi:hypothetical protein